MKQILCHAAVTRRVAEIEDAGGDCTGLEKILHRLQRGREIPDVFRDHPLAGKLKGLCSVVVGWTAEGRDVVMVYEAARQHIAVIIVDEHDHAYRTLRLEKAAKRGGSE